MALSAHAEDIPLPISGSYGNSHIYHHSTPNHVTPPTSTLPPSNGSINPDHAFPSYKRVMRYKECLKNHAASIGGNATDGCGEFMPAGPEGTLDALKCSACNCHRNFHRKDFHGDTDDACDCYRHLKGRKVGKGILVPTSESYAYPTNGHVPRSPVIMSYNLGVPSESDERQCGGGGMLITTAPILKKRFRTKFTPDQKEKMLGFAERVGWRIQKPEESVVQQFCQEIGIRRRVLKVWMHNNKHNLAKKINNSA